jgi:Tol biopolymer transport system component/DNA-binding winged helix-turn-helix (wHTH) protein
MASQPSSPTLLKFGPFELHSQSGELQKNGIRIRLSGQPLRILLLLLERPGEVVTREELRQQIWGDGTFVDFESGLNAAVNKLRRALNDSAEKPRYIETISGRGYRFIGVLNPAAPPPDQPATVPSMPVPNVPRRRAVWWLAAAAAIVAMFALGWRLRTPPPPPPHWQFTQLVAEGENSDSPAVSRDGKLLAYSSDKHGMRDLYVKQITGGQPIRLTLDGAGNTTPDFSPDGTKIVFRSNRDGGGIYEIAAFGGAARLLARDGLDPKYSPDGSKVAFWIGASNVLPTIPRTGTIWVVPSAGGQPLRLGATLATARHPIWSPDGRRLLVVGYASDKLRELSAFDWWTIQANGDVASKTGIRDALQAAGLESPDGDDFPQTKFANPESLPFPACWLPDPSRVIFSSRSGDARNLWSTQMSPEGRLAGAIQRLTTGSGNETKASCGSSETFVFARRKFASEVWSLPFDLDRGKPTGPAVQLTHQPSTVKEGPSLSADGQRVAFSLLESGVFNIWVRDTASGKETRLAPSSFLQRFPLITASGDRVAYSSYENDNRILYVAAPGGVPEKLCEGCIRPNDWSRDGKKLLTNRGSPYTISLLDVASHEETTLLAHPAYSLVLAHFSPDNRWVSFTARVQPNRAWILIAPADGPLPVPENEWIKVSEENDAQDASMWSPDSNMLYFTSSRDGHTCLWARRLDPNSHQPVGESFAVQHFHERPMEPLPIWSAGAGRIAVTLSENTSSIWMMSHPPPR